MLVKPKNGRDNGQSPPRLSLCMIVRDNATTLPPCLRSIRPWVDEIIVVDTGSLDDTPAIARDLGATVSTFPWCDDFSAARNESLRQARGQWLFWMDSDDTISADCGRRLRELADRSHDPRALGYVMQVHCPGAEGRHDFTAVDHVKLFRNHSELRFEGRIHEQILPAIRAMGGEVQWTDIFVEHSGADQSAEGRRRKHARDLRILRLDLLDRPNHPFVLFNLGMTYADMDEYGQAADWLRKSIEVAKPTESHLRKAFALLIGCLFERQEFSEAEQVCQEGLRQFTDDPEILFRWGMLSHHLQRFGDAEEAYRRVLRPTSERFFSSIDRGILGGKTRHNLACLYVDMGRDDLAEAHWRAVLEVDHGNRLARRHLVEALLRRNRPASAYVEIRHLERDEGDTPLFHILRAKWKETCGEVAAALAELELANNQYADNTEILEALSRFHFNQGHTDEAIAFLTTLTASQPQSGAHWRNLGVALLGNGEKQAGQAALRQSLDARPDCAATRELLNRVEQGEDEFSNASAEVEGVRERGFTAEDASGPLKHFPSSVMDHTPLK